jgi:thymidylate synthase (FAD)
MKSTVKFVSVTPGAEEQIVYCARVSNPKNQNNPSIEGLIRYCIEHKHWSIFEHGFLTVEVNTSLAIATQILRHSSLKFQQFSQRYADSTQLQVEIPVPNLRRQDIKNRQNSTDDIPEYLKLTLQEEIRVHFDKTIKLYNRLLDAGIAKESSRFVLPQATQTRMYISGNIRNFIHYLQVRTSEETQLEHREVAEAIKCIFVCQFPTIALALGWDRNENCPDCIDAPSITLE